MHGTAASKGSQGRLSQEGEDASFSGGMVAVMLEGPTLIWRSMSACFESSRSSAQAEWTLNLRRVANTETNTCLLSDSVELLLLHFLYSKYCKSTRSFTISPQLVRTESFGRVLARRLKRCAFSGFSLLACRPALVGLVILARLRLCKLV